MGGAQFSGNGLGGGRLVAADEFEALAEALAGGFATLLRCPGAIRTTGAGL